MKRVQPVYLTESALTSLSEYLSRSAVQVGDRLPAERIIAEQLGISRPILREALGRWASSRPVAAAAATCAARLNPAPPTSY